MFQDQMGFVVRAIDVLIHIHGQRYLKMYKLGLGGTQ